MNTGTRTLLAALALTTAWYLRSSAALMLRAARAACTAAIAARRPA